MTEEWNQLYLVAMQQINLQEISKHMQIGTVAAAVLT